MSNTRRPTLAKKVTTKTEANRDAELDAGKQSIKIDGTVYTINPVDVTGLIEAKVRRNTGLSVAEIAANITVAPGVDLVAYYMYACELAAGRDADVDSILASVSWASDVEILDNTGADPVPQP